MDPEVQRLFREAPWPGNVRRLENTIVHALGNGDPESGAIQVNDLPEWLRPAVEQTLKKGSRRNGSSGRSIKRNRTVPKPPASSA